MNKIKFIAIFVFIIISFSVGRQVGINQEKSRAPKVLGAKAKKSEIKIGAVLPLSGDFAAFGQEINRGAQIAVEELQKSGINIVYTSQDDQSSATGAVNSANKLIQVDKIDAALTATVQEVKPIAPIFEQANIPLVAVWDSNNYIKSAGKNIFTIGFSTEGAGEKMAEYAYHKLTIKKIAVLPQQDEWSELIASAFKTKFTALGGQVVFYEKTSTTQKDFRTLLAKIKTTDAQGIYAPLLPTKAGPFLIQTKQLGLNIPIMMGDSFSSDDVDVAKQAAEGVYFSNLYANDTKILAEKYKTKFGQAPSQDVFVSFGYDGVKTLFAGIQRAKNNGTKTADEIRQLNILGTDTEINFSGKQYSEKQERLYRVQNKQFVKIQ